jgi:hypothetical protein
MIYIYLLEFNDNTYYIGKTNNIKRRIKEHSHNFPNFIYSILDHQPENEWKFWEKYYISLFKSWGLNLQNKNNGGGGPNLVNIITKNKISNSLLNREITWKDKISKALKGKKYNTINVSSKYIIDKLPKDEIIKKYHFGESSIKIANEYNVSVVTIINLLKQNNVILTKNKINDSLKDKIINEYLINYNLKDLTTKFNLSKITIKNHLQQWGIFVDQRNKRQY